LLRIPARAGKRLPWLNAALGAVVVGGGIGAYVAVGPASAPTAAIRTATAARGVVTSSVSASGTVQSPLSVGINFKSGGQLVSVNVKLGQRVAKGQVLGRVDPTAAQLTVQTAKANLTSAKAQLAQTLAGETPQKRAQDKV